MECSHSTLGVLEIRPVLLFVIAYFKLFSSVLQFFFIIQPQLSLDLGTNLPLDLLVQRAVSRGSPRSLSDQYLQQGIKRLNLTIGT